MLRNIINKLVMCEAFLELIRRKRSKIIRSHHAKGFEQMLFKYMGELWNMLGRPIRTEDRLKQDLKAAAVVGFLGIVFGMFNFAEYVWIRGITPDLFSTLSSAVTILCGLLMMYFALIRKQHEPTVTVIVLYCFLVFSYIICTGRWGGAGILWSLLLPIIMCSFISVRYGILLSAFYTLMYFILFYSPLGKDAVGMYPAVFIRYFPMVYLCLSVLTAASMVQYHRIALSEIEYATQMKAEAEKQTRVAEDRNSQIEAMSFEALQTLAEIIDAKDPYTKGHSARVSQYAALLAREMKWPEERVNDVKNAALLHDIGKIGIPDSILNKPQRLTQVEYEIIKTHTTMGGDILRNGLMTQMAEDVAMSHHERYDGTGYPMGLKGEEISQEARLVAIADAFDTMSSNRIYRSASNRERIRRELLNGRGRQFDPEMTDKMIELWDRGILNPIMNENAPEVSEELEVPSELLQEAVEIFVSENADNVDKLAEGLKYTGNYKGALDVEYHQFAKFYEFIGHLEKRFNQPFRLLLISLKAEREEQFHKEELERAMAFMEKSIRLTVRSVDVITRYDLQHFLVILVGTDEDGSRIAVDRIFRGYYKMYGSGPYYPSYAVAESDHSLMDSAENG